MNQGRKQIPDDDPIFEDRSKSFLVRLVVGAIGVAALGLLAMPGWQWYRGRSNVSELQRAEWMVRQGKGYDEVAGVLNGMLKDATPHPRALRVAARLAAAERRPEAIPFWQRLLGTSEATVEDRLEFVECALNLGRADGVGAELATLMRRNPPEDRVVELWARHQEQNEDVDPAIAAARYWVGRAPGEGRASLQLGRMLMRHGDEWVRGEGQMVLLTVAAGNSSSTNAAVEALVASSELASSVQARLGEVLEPRASASFQNRLYLSKLRAREGEERAKQAVEAVLRDCGSARGAMLGETLRWVLDQGGSAELLKWATMERAATNGVVLGARLEALVKEGQWAEVRAVLERKELPWARGQREEFRALDLKQRGDAAGGEGEMLNAVRAAAGNGERLSELARRAIREGWIRAGVAAHEARLEVAGEIPSAVEALAAAVGLLPTARESLLEAQRLRAKAPHAVELEAEECYFRLLLNEGPAEARDRIARWAALRPWDGRVRMIQAFAELQSRNVAAARSILETQRIQWLTAPVRWQVIRVAVLGHSEDGDGARQWAKRIPLKKARPEELEWIKPWLGK